MSWRYVMSRERFTNGSDDPDDHEDVYSIREYYEASGGSGAGWTEDSIAPRGESPLELRTDLARMLLAASHDELLDLTLDPPRLVSLDTKCPMCNGGWDAGCGDSCCTPGPCRSCNGTGRR